MVARNLNDLRGICACVCVCVGGMRSAEPSWVSCFLPGSSWRGYRSSWTVTIARLAFAGLHGPTALQQFVGCFLLRSLSPSPPSRLTRRRQLRPKPGAINMLGQTHGCQGTVLLSRPSVSTPPHPPPRLPNINCHPRSRKKGERKGGGGEPQPINKIRKLGFLLKLGAKRKEERRKKGRL